MNKNKQSLLLSAARVLLAVGISAALPPSAHAAVTALPAGMDYSVPVTAFLGGVPVREPDRLARGDGATIRQSAAYDVEAVARYLVRPSVSPADPELDPIQTAAIVPGVFGSVAIPMRNFPVSARWRPIYQSMAGCSAAACTQASLPGILGSLKDVGFREKLDRVNRGVNQLLTYRRDTATYGRLDYWASPAETLARSAGDCEDFAILKMAALLEAGIPANSMSLVVLQDQSMGVFHAVLAVSTGSGTFILDNVRNAVVRDTSLPSYVPLYSFSTDRAWIHGSRKGGPQLTASKGGLASIAPGEGAAQIDPGSRPGD